MNNIGDLSATGGANGVFDWVGAELVSEYIIRPDFTVENEKEYEVWVKFRFPVEEMQQQLNDVTTSPYYLTIPEGTAQFNPIPYLILVGVILVVVFLLLVVLFFMVKRARARRAELDERKGLKKKIAEGKTFCPTCYRKLQPDWQSCLFCASGMAPLEEKPQAMLDAEEAQQRLDELDHKTEEQIKAAAVVAGTAGAAAVYAQQQGRKVCPTCHRVMDPSWAQCMFCQAGMAPLPQEQNLNVPKSEVAAAVAFGPDGVRPPLGAQEPQSPVQAPKSTQGVGQAAGAIDSVGVHGLDTCPKCGREVPKDWDECLYCKAGV